MRSLFMGILAACFATTAFADVLSRLQSGPWSSERNSDGSCAKFNIYEVSEDGTFLNVVFSEPQTVRGAQINDARYRILKVGEQWVDLFLENETWTDESGNLVWWRLAFLDDDRFVWLRSDWDWSNGKSTPPRFRCQQAG